MIEITTDGKRILARFAYERELVRRVKTVPGARWHPESKTWRYPLSMDTCRMFRKVFGKELQVMPALAEWARKEVSVENKLEQLREGWSEQCSGLERVAEEAPALYSAMQNRQYQLAGAAFLVEAKQSILADDPGLGKTLQTLAAIIQSDAKTILVACRRTATRTVWERETLRWAPTIATSVAQGSPTERQKEMDWFSGDLFFPKVEQERKMLIINIEMIRAKRIVVCPQGLGDSCPAYAVGECKHKYEAEYQWPFLFNRQWDAIILDESHNLLASTANYQSKRITQARYGAIQLRKCLKPDGLAVALSGTPFRSNLTKSWGTLNWLRPDVFGSYWRFAETHFGVEQGQYGKIVADGMKAPRPIDQEFFDRMLRPYYLKRDKATAAPDLPPIIYSGTPVSEEPGSPCYVQVDMEPAQAKLYKQMVRDACADLLGGRIRANSTLAAITRLRQFANACGQLGGAHTVLPALPSSKLDWIIDFMQERQGTNRKVVIASSFTEMVNLTAEVLRKEGFSVLTLTGATSDRDRSDLVARFAADDDDVQVVVINTEAGGESITLDAADEMIIIDQPWNSDKEDQLTARIHRVSRMHQVTVYRLASAGTVDTWIAAMNNDQRAALATVEMKTLSWQIKEASDDE